MDITEEQMFEYLKMSINNLQDSISDFYLEMIKYDKKIGKNCMSRIYGNFMKISKTWENSTYDSQIFKDFETIISGLESHVVLQNQDYKNAEWGGIPKAFSA